MHVLRIWALPVALLTAASCATHPAPRSHAREAFSARFLAHFNPSKGELPEGLALTAEAAYLSFAPSAQVIKVDLNNGAISPFGQLPVPIPKKGFVTGIAVAGTGEFYVGLASFTPEIQAGVYRLPKTGGAASLFASDPAMPSPTRWLLTARALCG